MSGYCFVLLRQTWYQRASGAQKAHTENITAVITRVLQVVTRSVTCWTEGMGSQASKPPAGYRSNKQECQGVCGVPGPWNRPPSGGAAAAAAAVPALTLPYAPLPMLLISFSSWLSMIWQLLHAICDPLLSRRSDLRRSRLMADRLLPESEASTRCALGARGAIITSGNEPAKPPAASWPKPPGEEGLKLDPAQPATDRLAATAAAAAEKPLLLGPATKPPCVAADRLLGAPLPPAARLAGTAGRGQLRTCATASAASPGAANAAPPSLNLAKLLLTPPAAAAVAGIGTSMAADCMLPCSTARGVVPCPRGVSPPLPAPQPGPSCCCCC